MFWNGGPAETRGLPDCFRANHRRLSGSPGPLRTLRAGPRGTGEPSRKWGGSEASHPSQSPFRGGLPGNGMLPVILQRLSPARRRRGALLASPQGIEPSRRDKAGRRREGKKAEAVGRSP